MTSWPSHTDYQDAIQNPHICFEADDLKAAEVGCDMLGLPKVMSGNFACVYSVTTGGERYAIRCFVRQVLGQQGRYARLSQNLCGLGLPCMVTFDFILRGIKVKNEWYPIVKMQWVDGLPLNQHVEECFDNADTMRDLAGKWRVLMKGLRENLLAHGDLQHGNVMVTTDGEFRLVDYDGMFTTAFRGKSPELGHINFQHPRRTPDYYNEDLDNFAALVIYTSFLALASEPELFKKFYTGDNLLFLSADYRNPTQSETFKRLKENKDPKVQQLATLLERLCMLDVSKVPGFEDTLVALENGTIGDLIGAAPVVSASTAPASSAVVDWLQASAAEPVKAGGAPAAPAAPRPAPAPAPRPMTPAAPRPVPSPTPMNRPSATPIPRPAAPAFPKPAAPKPAAPAPAPVRPPAAKPVPTAVWIAMGIGAVIIVFLLAYLFGKK